MIWINKIVKIIHGIAIAMALALAFITAINDLIYAKIIETMIIPIASSLVIYAVCQIRLVIKSIEYALPNHKLMSIIFINYLMFAVFCFTCSVLELVYFREIKKNGDVDTVESLKIAYALLIFRLISQTFAHYAAIFLVVLILWFTRERQLAEVQDSLLGKKVPKIVFI